MKPKLIWFALAPLLAAVPHSGETDGIEIEEWLVPWENSRPRDPYVDANGTVWFVGQRSHYVASFSPTSGEFARFELEPGTGPHNLIVDQELRVWYAGNLKNHIGRLDPGTGEITKIPMPDPAARDPHTLVFESSGDIWFTVQQGNFVGRLDVDTSSVDLIAVPTPRARPYGIVLDSGDTPWVVEFGSNRLARIDPATMTLEEVVLPRDESRPRRLAITSDDRIWWADYALGLLGRYDPDSGEFREWPLPGGADSRPYGMAVDRNDVLWVVETGDTPNRFVGFDTRRETFTQVAGIPSGGGTVRHMYYHEPSGSVWFGTDTNYLGRARVH